MTPAEALAAIRQSGTVEAVDDKLKIRVPKARLAGLQPVLEVLRNAKTEVLSVLANTTKPERSDLELARATAVLNQAGVRIMRLVAGDAIGIWSDLDSAALRQALRVLGMGRLKVVYLDGPGVADRFKLRSRHVSGEPVPSYVLKAMLESDEPWLIRDRMLARGWKFVPWPAAPPRKRGPDV